MAKRKEQKEAVPPLGQNVTHPAAQNLKGPKVPLGEDRHVLFLNDLEERVHTLEIKLQLMVDLRERDLNAIARKVGRWKRPELPREVFES